MGVPSFLTTKVATFLPLFCVRPIPLDLPLEPDASRGHPLRRVRRPRSLSYTKWSARSMPSTCTAPPRSFFCGAGYELRAKESSG